jgi:diaminopimelate decarboxylase
MTVDLLRLAKEFGTPLYVYDGDAMAHRLTRIRSLLDPRIKVFYAAKANPNRHLLGRIRSQIDGLDVSSGGEIKQALLAGFDGADLSFAGPGKTVGEIELALQNRCASMSIESNHDLQRILEVCRRAGRTANVSLRLNPQAAVKEFAIKMGGIPSPFGVDEECAGDILRVVRQERQFLNLIGFHVYAGTQCLALDGLTRNVATVLEIVEKICGERGQHPGRINFGGGLGIPYFAADTDFDFKAFADFVNEAVARFDERRSRPAEYVIELGRYLVGPFGYYLSQILSVKESRGRKYIVLDGGIHQNLAPSGHFGQIIRKNYDIVNVSRPAAVAATVDIVGCLCTTLDRLASGIEIGLPRVGDIVAIKNSGAYGLTASPLLFLGHETPREILVRHGIAEVIREPKDITEFN